MSASSVTILIVRMLETTRAAWQEHQSVEAGNLIVPKFNMQLGMCYFGYRAPAQWNIIKIELKSAVNVATKLVGMVKLSSL